MNSQTHPKLRSRKRVAGSRKLAISTMWAATATVASLAMLMTLPATVAIAQTTPVAIAPVPTTPIRDGFTLATVGDIIYLRPMLSTIESRSPEMLKILREANVTFGNFETSVIDLSGFQGSPQAESGGTWMIAEPRTTDDLAKMGFDIVSHANNHATDWGKEGLVETLRRLDESGLVNSGTGLTLSAARAPRYLDTSSGRVGLVSATSSFPPSSRAGDPLGEVPGRPGVNAMRTERVRLVSSEDLAVISRIAETADKAPVILEGVRYRAVETPGAPAKLSFELNKNDEKANLLSVRQAKQNGNFVIFSLHNHNPGNASEVPADFAPKLARRVIDEGADAFVGHGPHQLRGIEIYKGKPIFYSLGNFAMMNNSLDVAPADLYEQYGVEPGTATMPELLQGRAAQRFYNPQFYEAVIAVSRYVGGRVAEIRLFPIDMNDAVGGAGKGVPRMADAAMGRKILERLQRLSSPFGTTIAIERGVGIIRVQGTDDARP